MGAEPLLKFLQKLKENRALRMVFAVTGIMSTLLVYGVLQEKIMRVPYGPSKEYFKYSLFLVFITTSAVSAAVLLASRKVLDPVAPIYKYCVLSVSNILTTTCQYEIWGTVIMRKTYSGRDYLLTFLVTLGCSIFILYPPRCTRKLGSAIVSDTKVLWGSYKYQAGIRSIAKDG